LAGREAGAFDQELENRVHRDGGYPRRRCVWRGRK